MDLFECEIVGCTESAMQDVLLSDEDDTLQMCDSCLEYFKTDTEYEVVKTERYNSTWTGDSNE
jgi:hypothetical protein